MISAKPNNPIATVTTPMPSVSSGIPKANRATPELTSVPTMPSRRPRMIIAIAFKQRSVRQHDGADQAQHHQRKVFGRAELERELRQRYRHRRDQDRRHRAGEERGEGRDRQRRAGLSLAGHLVAIEAGDDRRRFARHVDEDRRRRAAVLRAVVDAGQHDQRGHRLQRIGRRQQHRDGRDGADARQHADERAEHDADQCVEKVDRRQRDAEAQGEMTQQIQGIALWCPFILACARPDPDLQLEPDHEHADGEHRQKNSADDRFLRPELAARGAGHQDQQDRRQHEARVIDDEAEDNDAAQHDDDRPPFPAGQRRTLRAAATAAPGWRRGRSSECPGCAGSNPAPSLRRCRACNWTR